MATPVGPDRFSAHLIPTGIDPTPTPGRDPGRDGSLVHIVSATVVFTPVPSEKANGGDGLHNWPVWIRKLFESEDKIRIKVRSALGTDTGKELALARSSFAERYRRPAQEGQYSASGSSGVSDAVNRLWKKWFGGASGNFNELRQVLHQAATRDASSVHKDMMQTGPDANVPDIIAVPRAELAHQLTLARARDLAEHIVEALPTDTSRGSDARTKRLDRLRATTFEARPWARSPSKDEKDRWVKPAALATRASTYEPYRYEPIPSDEKFEWMRKLKPDLQAERLFLDLALGKKLHRQRKLAVEYVKAHNSCKTAGGLDALRTFLQERNAVFGLETVNATAEQVVAEPEKFEAALDENLAVHHASTLPDHATILDDDEKTTVPKYPAKMEVRWHSLQGMHALARVVHLVVDITFELPAAVLAELQNNGEPEAYAEFALDAGEHTWSRPWTLTRITLNDGVWPTSVEEFACNAPLAPDERSDSEQKNGVVNLAIRAKEAGGGRQYEVVTLDVHFAAESETRRQRAVAEMDEVIKEANRFLPQDDLEQSAEVSTMKSGGLQLVDRWRQASCLREFINSASTEGSDITVDVNDLALGYKLDVGVLSEAPEKGGERDWRSLTERRIVYKDYADSNNAPADAGDPALEELINVFLPGGPKTGAEADSVRLELDGAVLTAGSRLVTNGTDPQDDSGKITAFAEPILLNWDGDPLGQRIGKFDGKAGPDAIPVSQTAALFNTEGQRRRPHRLRFGRSYSVGMRKVLLGGVTASRETAFGLYERNFAYPETRTEFQRFLRHERIGPPMTAVEADLLIGEFASERRGLDSKAMVVRSPPAGATLPLDESEAWRFQPSETTRVLFAPPVDVSFATLHGVFDAVAKKIGGSPADGLADVDYDADWGGFPVFNPVDPPIEEAIRSEYREEEKPDVPNAVNEPRRGVPGGFAVLRAHDRRRNPRDRFTKYYPDPAARYMMIALRRPGHPAGYLRGKAIRVPLYPGAKEQTASASAPGYPDARPVIVKVRTLEWEARPLASYDDLRRRAGKKSDADWPLERVVKGAGKATAVTIFLLPGEEFEVEAWCLPDETQVRAWFDAPEALALLRVRQNGSEAKILAEALSGIELPGYGSDDPRAGWKVRRGDAPIPWRDVHECALAVYEAMQHRPLSEMAGIQRLQAIHAAGLPNAAPEFTKPDTGGHLPLRLVRVLPAVRDAVFETTEIPEWDNDGARDIVIGGTAEVDPETTENLELRVRGSALTSEPMDDARRGRSFDMRARGLWPRTRIDPDSGELVPVLLGQTGDEAKSYMEELFGFDVTPWGTPSLRRSDGLLAKWTIERGSATTVDLLQLTRDFVKHGPKPANERDRKRSPIETLLSDTRARRLTLSLTATSRTARHIPERRVYPTPVEESIDQRRLHRPSSPPDVELVLRSTERPAALSTKSLLPAFTWERSGADGATPGSAKRKTKIRIRLRRPWWTSGEDERVGIVVWPPNLRRVAPTRSRPDDWTAAELARGIIRRVAPFENEAQAEIDLNRIGYPEKVKWRDGYLSDDDLGPGGSYVTRWASDPIFNSDDVSWLIPYDAFYDLRDLPENDFAPPIDAIETSGEDTGGLWLLEDRHKPRFVENVLMPIPDQEGNEPGATLTAEQLREGKTPEFMLVSLVTYMPRFSADFEYWYVDFDLDVGHARDPFVRLGLVRYQPHARRHLQVSAPQSLMVQVVNYERFVTLERDAATIAPNGSAKGATQHFVWVKLQTPTGPNLDSESGAPPPADGVSEPPKFRATLIESRRLPSGQIVERVARIVLSEAECEARGIRPGDVIVESDATAGSSILWSVKLPLPQALEDNPAVSYAVQVEEVLVAEPSSYSNEPVRKREDIQPDERTIESGPRFAVRVEVNSLSTLAPYSIASEQVVPPTQANARVDARSNSRMRKQKRRRRNRRHGK